MFTKYLSIKVRQSINFSLCLIFTQQFSSGVLKCGEVTCPQGSFRCSIETVSDEIRGQDGMSDTMTTWTKCTNQKLKVLKTHSTTMRSPKPDMKITIKTSASIDGVEKNESMSEQGRLKSQGMPFRLFEIATSVQPPATTETFSMRSAFKH